MKRIILITLIIVFALIMGNASLVGFTSLRLSKDIINNKTANFKFNYKLWRGSVWFLEKTKFKLIRQNLAEYLGVNQEKIYFVLLQNNFELRPSGGFMGSYAKLSFKDGGLSKVDFQDIYVPDGQIGGHVDPPKPIQDAFQQGWYRLRDANFDPDFKIAAETTSWFFEKGNEVKPDGIIALNLITIRNLVGITGKINLTDYQIVIDKDNLYQFLQTQSNFDFFPGSTQKKDAVSAVGRYLVDNIKNSSGYDLLRMTKQLIGDLNKQQILIYFNDEQLNKFIGDVGWSGRFEIVNKNDADDYFYIVDTNLGSNKADCCIKRMVEHTILSIDSNKIEEKIKINYQNVSPKDPPPKPLFWGGSYKNYLRVYLPSGVEIKNVSVNEISVPSDTIDIDQRFESGWSGIGFWVVTEPESQSRVLIEYQIPNQLKNTKEYRVKVFRQPGIENFDYCLKYSVINEQENCLIQKTIDQKQIITIPIRYN